MKFLKALKALVSLYSIRRFRDHGTNGDEDFDHLANRKKPKIEAGGAEAQSAFSTVVVQYHLDLDDAEKTIHKARNKKQSDDADQKAQDVIDKFTQCFETENNQTAAIHLHGEKYGDSESVIRKAYSRLKLQIPK